MNEKSRLFTIVSWLAVAVMAGVIFWMSANTGESINHGLGIVSTIKAWLSDAALHMFGHSIDVSPIGHLTEYLILGILLANALRLHVPLTMALVLAVAIASAYGVTDEIHQIFVSGRSCDPADWAVDTIAAAIGAIAVYLFLRARRSAKPSNHE